LFQVLFVRAASNDVPWTRAISTANDVDEPIPWIPATR